MKPRIIAAIFICLLNFSSASHSSQVTIKVMYLDSDNSKQLLPTTVFEIDNVQYQNGDSPDLTLGQHSVRIYPGVNGTQEVFTTHSIQLYRDEEIDVQGRPDELFEFEWPAVSLAIYVDDQNGTMNKAAFKLGPMWGPNQIEPAMGVGNAIWQEQGTRVLLPVTQIQGLQLQGEWAKHGVELDIIPSVEARPLHYYDLNRKERLVVTQGMSDPHFVWKTVPVRVDIVNQCGETINGSSFRFVWRYYGHDPHKTGETIELPVTHNTSYTDIGGGFTCLGMPFNVYPAINGQEQNIDNPVLRAIYYVKVDENHLQVPLTWKCIVGCMSVTPNNTTIGFPDFPGMAPIRDGDQVVLPSTDVIEWLPPSGDPNLPPVGGDWISKGGARLSVTGDNYSYDGIICQLSGPNKIIPPSILVNCQPIKLSIECQPPCNNQNTGERGHRHCCARNFQELLDCLRLYPKEVPDTLVKFPPLSPNLQYELKVELTGGPIPNDDRWIDLKVEDTPKIRQKTTTIAGNGKWMSVDRIRIGKGITTIKNLRLDEKNPGIKIRTLLGMEEKMLKSIWDGHKGEFDDMFFDLTLTAGGKVIDQFTYEIDFLPCPPIR